jgi:ABC-type branched-subunit amino acid transport system ATPase component
VSALEVGGLTVVYGGVRAVDNVSFCVEGGAVTALIGPNGAGKTSAIDGITGFAASTGSIRVRGDEVSHLPPHRRAAKGMARTWQNSSLFSELNVTENVRLATDRATMRSMFGSLFRQSSEVPAEVKDALAMLRLESIGNCRPSELSHGMQKLVGVARALASGAGLLLLDEPAAGLDDNETDVLRDQLRLIADRGRAVLLVEHDMRLVFSICDYMVVMDQGRVIATGEPDSVRHDPQVLAAYLGTPMAVAE